MSIRVKLSKRALSVGLFVRSDPNRQGTVIPWRSPYLHKNYTQVLWDGLVTPYSLHNDYLEEVPTDT